MSRFRICLIMVLFTFVFILPQLKPAFAADIDDLIAAVWGLDTPKAVELIDGGVDVNGKDANGTYPLLLACSYKDNDEMIEMLLSKGANPNIHGPEGQTPLASAAKYSLKAVQMLVEKGADINAKDDAGFTALHWAREMEQQDIVEFLKKKGAKV
jgi:ankyrin repeat protein